MTANWQKKSVFGGTIVLCSLVIVYHTYLNVEATLQLNDAVIKTYNLTKITDNTKGQLQEKSDCKKPRKLTNLFDFFNYGKTYSKATCVNIAEVGGHSRKHKDIFPYSEGSRIVCLDGIKIDDCVVLSFGISYDTSFDNDIEFIVGCKVYMFDPTIGQEDFKIPPNKEFYNMALSDRKGIIQIGPHTCKADRYEGILQMLNLTDHKIDYLKIDIDGSEVDVFNDLFNTSLHLLENVHQIGMEIHPILDKRKSSDSGFINAFQPYWEIMHRLECLGFDLISFIPNIINICKFHYMGQKVSGCYDFVFVKRTENVLGI